MFNLDKFFQFLRGEIGITESTIEQARQSLNEAIEAEENRQLHQSLRSRIWDCCNRDDDEAEVVQELAIGHAINSLFDRDMISAIEDSRLLMDSSPDGPIIEIQLCNSVILWPCHSDSLQELIENLFAATNACQVRVCFGDLCRVCEPCDGGFCMSIVDRRAW